MGASNSKGGMGGNGYAQPMYQPPANNGKASPGAGQYGGNQYGSPSNYGYGANVSGGSWRPNFYGQNTDNFTNGMNQQQTYGMGQQQSVNGTGNGLWTQNANGQGSIQPIYQQPTSNGKGVGGGYTNQFYGQPPQQSGQWANRMFAQGNPYQQQQPTVQAQQNTAPAATAAANVQQAANQQAQAREDAHNELVLNGDPARGIPPRPKFYFSPLTQDEKAQMAAWDAQYGNA